MVKGLEEHPVSYSEWRPHIFLLGAVGAGLAGLLAGALLAVFMPRGYLSGYEYHVWRWEAENLVASLFRHAGIGPSPGDEAADEALLEYFRLTTDIRNTQAQPSPDTALIEALRAERTLYENDVERIIERRINDAIGDADLRRSLPLFRDVQITWPPVDLELTTPPRLLVRSPRAEIRRAGDTLLRDSIGAAEIERIESETDTPDLVSIVVPVGGIAVYPSIVRDDRSYDALLNTAAHEWVHHYLAFFPLGRQWGKGSDATTLNETVADLAGVELANMVRDAYPTSFPPSGDGARTVGTAPAIDFNAEMRELRLQVDELLAGGRVSEAEALMEATRLHLAEHGIHLRKLNQAYFAFYGTYAESPAASDPIGPLTREVWEATGDVGAFLTLMRDITSRSELEALVTSLSYSETVGRP